MKVATFAVALLLLALVSSETRLRNISGEAKAEKADSPPASERLDAEYLALVPDEKRFVTEAGHAVVVLAIGQCKSGETGANIELRSPTPGFVQLIPACIGDGRAIGALVINPTNKDIGLYTVNAKTHGCDSTAQEWSFQVKVKRPSS